MDFTQKPKSKIDILIQFVAHIGKYLTLSNILQSDVFQFCQAFLSELILFILHFSESIRPPFNNAKLLWI